MPDIAVELPRILIEAAKGELHATGCVPRPQVHMLAEDMPNPYIGFVTCRSFDRGRDAVAAIGGLGTLPSVMKMTRLMILWESSDLALALDQATVPSPMALMLLDASLSHHALHWHPFKPVPTGRIVNGVPTVQLEWESQQRANDASLPEPITLLLQTWRELRDDNIQETAIALQRSGYELDWIESTR